MAEKQQEFVLHNIPSFYVAYTQNWVAHKRKEKNANPADIAILDDIRKLVELAASVLEPVPAEPGTEKQNDNGNKSCS